MRDIDAAGKGHNPMFLDRVLDGRHYDELDGALSYEHATAFATIYKTLTTSQKNTLKNLRSHHTRETGTAFLYSDRIQMPAITDSSFLFGTKTGKK